MVMRYFMGVEFDDGQPEVKVVSPAPMKDPTPVEPSAPEVVVPDSALESEVIADASSTTDTVEAIPEEQVAADSVSEPALSSDPVVKPSKKRKKR